jgi:monoamine oxidase
MPGDSTVGLPQEQCDFVVVGAGFAGLTAALRLKKHGSVIVLEARDYVGGRVRTETLEDGPWSGTWIDLGGTWFGPGQTYAYDLAAEMGVPTYPTYDKGDSVLLLPDGTVVRSPETFPLRELCTAIDAAVVLEELEEMAKEVPLDTPWTAPQAELWDGQTWATWVDTQLADSTPTARAALKSVMEGFFTADAGELSLLHVLYLIHSHGGLMGLSAVKGGDQQDRVRGGAQAIALAIQGRLGDAVRLSSPVRQINQLADGVEVVADTVVVRANRAVVAMPPTVAGRIRYEPPLSTARAMLVERAPSGEVFKFLAMYEKPFWRDAGYSGVSGAISDPITLTIDGATDKQDAPGMIFAFAAGRNSRALAQLTKADRQRRVVETLAKRFDAPEALTPVSFFEHEWSDDPWSGGGMIVHFPPGVLTNFGPALTDPVGRIHWAGSESSGAFHCSINAAIESGERAAAHVVAAMSGG